MRIFLAVLLSLSTVFISPGLAMDRFDIVTTGELDELLAARERGEAKFVLVNTLDEIIFLHSSIPGSVNVPWYRVNELSARLGQDPDQLVITY